MHRDALLHFAAASQETATFLAQSVDITPHADTLMQVVFLWKECGLDIYLSGKITSTS